MWRAKASSTSQSYVLTSPPPREAHRGVLGGGRKAIDESVRENERARAIEDVLSGLLLLAGPGGAQGNSVHLGGPLTAPNGHRFSMFLRRRAQGDEEKHVQGRKVTGGQAARPCMGPPRQRLPQPAPPNAPRTHPKQHTKPPSKSKLVTIRGIGEGMRKEAKEFKGREGRWQQKHGAKIKN